MNKPSAESCHTELRKGGRKFERTWWALTLWHTARLRAGASSFKPQDDRSSLGVRPHYGPFHLVERFSQEVKLSSVNQ